LETYTLFDLNEYIKRVISLNFQEPIWISCEVAQCKNSRGNFYLDLVQQDENDLVVAQASAVLWSKNYFFLKNKLKDLLNQLLVTGVQIKIKVTVEFNEKYGLKYVIEDIDPTFTFGLLEINKQKIIDRLVENQLMEKNKLLRLPKVISKIAIISSGDAAGYADFIKKIEQNIYGYAYDLKLFSSALQGLNTEREMIANIIEINRIGNFDAILIIRGGGSKLDLAAFDNYEIAKNIAESRIPILTGIGHDIDNSIADMVANKSFITPTAVADYLIEHSMLFENKILDYHSVILDLSKYRIKDSKAILNNLNFQLSSSSLGLIKTSLLNLKNIEEIIAREKVNIIKVQKEYLKNISSKLDLLNPKQILKRGFALIKGDNGKFISSKETLLGNEIQLIFHDGEKIVKVDKSK
jgi:exodeoxyribonuclease VII large subunit